MTQQKRILALLLSIAVILFLLSSSAFIVIHADHDWNSSIPARRI